eukprot:UN31762
MNNMNMNMLPINNINNIACPEGIEAKDKAKRKIIVAAISSILSQKCATNTSNIQNNATGFFESPVIPNVSIADYLERVSFYSHCTVEVLILALIYVDRLIERRNFMLTFYNIHRLVVTAVMLAAKYFDDKYFNNKYYARIGGISLREMNALEVEFVNLLYFRLYVQPAQFEQYESRLLKHFSSNIKMQIENISLSSSDNSRQANVPRIAMVYQHAAVPNTTTFTQQQATVMPNLTTSNFQPTTNQQNASASNMVIPRNVLVAAFNAYVSNYMSNQQVPQQQQQHTLQASQKMVHNNYTRTTLNYSPPQLQTTSTASNNYSTGNNNILQPLQNNIIPQQTTQHIASNLKMTTQGQSRRRSTPPAATAQYQCYNTHPSNRQPTPPSQTVSVMQYSPPQAQRENINNIRLQRKQLSQQQQQQSQYQKSNYNNFAQRKNNSAVYYKQNTAWGYSRCGNETSCQIPEMMHQYRTDYTHSHTHSYGQRAHYWAQ